MTFIVVVMKDRIDINIYIAIRDKPFRSRRDFSVFSYVAEHLDTFSYISISMDIESYDVASFYFSLFLQNNCKSKQRSYYTDFFISNKYITILITKYNTKFK